MSVDSLAKIFEGIFAMQTTRLNHRQNAFDKTAARYAVATKAAPTLSMGASKPATYGRFKTSQGLDVHGPLFFPSRE
jgi:hypothetical protein